MANESMRDDWATGGEGWVRNERIFDAAFAPFTAAILGAADLGSARRVLDVGCGSGTLLDAAVAAGADAVGVDISSAMVEAARRRVPTATVRHGRRADRRPARGRAGRAVRPGGVALRGDVLRRARGGVRKHPVRHGARSAPRVRVLARGRDLHVLARPPFAHGAPGRSAHPTEDRRAGPDGPGQRRTGYARSSPLPAGRT